MQSIFLKWLHDFWYKKSRIVRIQKILQKRETKKNVFGIKPRLMKILFAPRILIFLVNVSGVDLFTLEASFWTIDYLLYCHENEKIVKTSTSKKATSLKQYFVLVLSMLRYNRFFNFQNVIQYIFWEYLQWWSTYVHTSHFTISNEVSR